MSDVENKREQYPAGAPEASVPKPASLHVEKLLLDKFNPRLPGKYHDRPEMEILEYFLRDGTLLDLMRSIAQTGFYTSEPLLVIPAQDTPGNYVVVEGNRRLTALKLLHHPDLARKSRPTAIAGIVAEAKVVPKKVPVLIYESRNQILDYLGYRHITGIKEWGALEKARYVYQLYEREEAKGSGHEEIFRLIARNIGSRADAVARILLGYRLYLYAREHDYFDIPNELNEEKIEFSLLTTAINSPDIRTFIGVKDVSDLSLSSIDTENTKDLFQWVYKKDENGNTVLGESRNLKVLAKIVARDKAVLSLRATGSIETAALYTEHADDSFAHEIGKASRSLGNCKNMLESLANPSKGTLEELERLRKMIGTIMAALQEIYGIRL